MDPNSSHTCILNASEFTSCLSQKHRIYYTSPFSFIPYIPVAIPPPKMFDSYLLLSIPFTVTPAAFHYLFPTNIFITLIGLYSKSLTFKTSPTPNPSSTTVCYLSKVRYVVSHLSVYYPSMSPHLLQYKFQLL